MNRILVGLLIACCSASSALWAQTRDSNPHASAQDVIEGRRLYSFFCVFCHGMDGASGRGARLASAFRRHGVSDRDQYRVIADGVPGTEMSAHNIEEDEIGEPALAESVPQIGAPAAWAPEATRTAAAA